MISRDWVGAWKAIPLGGRNSLINAMGQLATFGVSILATRSLFAQEGSNALGAISLMLVANGLLTGFLAGGLGWSVIQALSGETDAQQVEAARPFASVYLAAGLFLAGGILLLRPWVASFFFDEVPESGETIVSAWAFQALLLLLLLYERAVLRAVERVGLLNILDVGRSILYNGGILLLLQDGRGLSDIALWMPASTIPILLFQSLVVGRVVGWRALRPSISSGALRASLSRAKPNITASGWGLARQFTDRVLVAFLLALEQVGIFNFAFNAVSRLTMLRQAVAGALVPALTRQRREEGINDSSRSLRLHLLITLAFMPTAGLAAIWVPLLIEYTLSSAAMERSFSAVLFLTMGYAIGFTTIVISGLLVADNKSAALSRVRRNALVASVVPGAASIAIWSLAGAGLSTMVYQMLLMLFLRKESESLFGGLWLRSNLLALAVAVTSFLPIALVLRNFQVPWMVVLGSVISLCLYGAGIAGVTKRLGQPSLSRLASELRRRSVSIASGSD